MFILSSALSLDTMLIKEWRLVGIHLTPTKTHQHYYPNNHFFPHGSPKLQITNQRSDRKENEVITKNVTKQKQR